MVSAKGWIGGPRWDTKQGSLSATNGTGSNDDSDDDSNDTTETAVDEKTGLAKLWDEHKAVIIIIALLVVFVTFAMSSMSLVLVL